MVMVNVHKAKTQLSQLLQRMEAGEEVIIARAGKPVARLVPYESATRGRVPGLARGSIQIRGDVTQTWSDEELAEWEKEWARKWDAWLGPGE
jgi:prevent-host-death family protein